MSDYQKFDLLTNFNNMICGWGQLESNSKCRNATLNLG